MRTPWSSPRSATVPTSSAFEKSVWRIFREDLKAGRFDLVHRITPMSPTLPSYLPRRCPVPFVLGPLNGNLPWPPQFTQELKREREWFSVFRRFYKVLPYVRSTYACSGAILAAFDHTLKDLPATALSKAINFPEVGIDPELFSMPERPRRDRLTVLYAGRLVPYKLPEVVVRAFASSPALRRHRLKIVGDGPERPRLEALVREGGLGDSVEFLGQKTQSEVGRLMRESEIFAFPSIRELGAGVVVEAMACGMACVVVDYGGPATLIDSDRGAKVELGTLDQLVGRFARELESLAGDPDRVERLGRAAHRHAMTHYAWDAKAQKTMEVYRWLLGRASQKPRFWDAVAI